jgi:PAS domain S-box-containing protein
MENAGKDISCYTTALVIKHAKKSGVADAVLFDEIQEYKNLLLNPLEWVDGRIVSKLLGNYVKAKDGDCAALTRAGIEITLSQITHFQLLFLKIFPLSVIAKKLEQLTESSIAKMFSLQIKLNGKAGGEMITKVHYPEKYSTYMCQYNKGCAIGTLMAKGYKNIQVSETSCAALNNLQSCVFEFSWDTSYRPFEKLKSWFFFRFKSQKNILSHMETAHQRLVGKHEELLSLQEFYSHILRSMDESILWCSLDATIEFCNFGFSRMTGFAESEIIGKKFIEFPGLTGEKIMQIGSGQYDQFIKPQIFELQFNKPEKRPIICEATVLFVPQGTRKAGILIVIRDVTLSRAAAKQLSLAEKKYRSLYENSPALIIGLNIAGKIIYANPALVESTGFSEQELKTMGFMDLIAPGTNIDLQKIYAEKFVDSSNLMELQFRTKRGQWKAVTMSTYPLQDEEGKSAGLAGIGIDITETKRLNELIVKAQRMELLGQMAGGLAHDFKNILASISGYAEIINVRTKEEKTKMMANIITEGTIHADELIKKLLSFSRGNNEQVKLNRVNLNKIVSEAGKLVQGAVSADIRVETRVPNEQFYIIADAGGIHQCILNLCMNAKDALKEKPDGNGFIMIRLSAGAPLNSVRIEVEDNGLGIAPHLIEKIFDPFFTTKKDRGGTGLGLSVVYGIVKTHNGAISLDSHPGQGVTFKIELPLAPAPDAPTQQSTEKKIIAVLDDEPVIRGFCSEVFQHYGYESVSFSSVENIVNWLVENKNNTWFILSDIFLPEMKPREFAEKCSHIESRLKIMWMSGCPVPDSLIDFITPNIFIKKPFTPYEFIERIKSFALTVEGQG